MWYEIVGGEWHGPFRTLQELLNKALLNAATNEQKFGKLTPLSMQWVGHGKLEINFEFTPVYPKTAGNMVIRAIEVATTP